MQDQGNTPGRQQGFKRTSIEEPDDTTFDHQPDQRCEQERQWQCDSKRPVEQAGITGADDVLHHVSDIGTQHDHFAMCHIDDAHDAEGNCKADGGEQQHRAE
ncbi:hypothetical protein D3C81_1843250 [compost metagenome]